MALQLGTYDNRLSGIETRIAVMLVMLGGLYALTASGIWKLARIAIKIGAFT